MDIDRLKENIDFESYNVTTESGERLVVIEKDRLIEIVDMLVKESDSLPCVSDRRGLFIAFAEYMDTDDPNEFQGLPYGDIVDNFFKARNSR